MTYRRGAARVVARVGGAGALALGAWTGIVSCSPSPFHAHEDDYAKRVALSRLREVPPAGLEAFRKPAPETGAPAPEAVAAARARFEGLEQADLTLEACRASALRHNLSLRVAVLDPTLAAERVREEEARFDGAFTLRTGWNNFDSPTASTLTSAQSEQRFIVPGVRLPLRTGGTVTVNMPVSRSENDNAFSTLNPSYTSDLEFSISHPLLRGAGRRANSAGLRVLGYEAQAGEARTKLEVIRQLAAVDRSYWRLYQAKRELEVRQQQYELAAEQLGRAERRQRAGAVSEIEVVRAQAGAADRLEAIIVAQNTVLLQQRELKRIVNDPALSLESRTLIATATPPDPVEYVFDPAALLASAVGNRMEMLELELQLAADAVRIESARDGTLPLLTLDYTYRVNGLGGSMQDTFHTLQRNNFADWELGLTAEVPFANDAAKSRVRQAILGRLSRLATREAREQSIRQEVLNAVDALEAGWQRILAARQSVILNTRALQGEQRQFDVGAATSTDVLDASARLADAQSAEVRALADYQIAQVDLAFATGTLLGAAKVEWSPAEPPGLDTPDPPETVGDSRAAPPE